ncbi:MAG: glutamate 5-kinase [Dehalococcoidia bacterium]
MALHPSDTATSADRPALAYRRIVVKAGTNVLTGKSPRLDRPVMESLVDQMVRVRSLGAQVVLVTSGAIAAGREAMSASPDAKVQVRQMLAAVGQSRLMHAYQELFSKSGVIVAQALLTRRDVEDRVGYLNVRNTLESLLDNGAVPIVNENDVVDTAEIGQERFGDNDTLSALVANLIDADLLLILTDTGGLYTADPKRDPDATLIPRVDEIGEAVMALAEAHRSTISRGGMGSKLEAARRAVSAGVTAIIANGREPDVLPRVACGEALGTLFPTTVTAMESRKRWLLSGMAESGGVLVIDEGAARAVAEHARSLLPAGVREVRGVFNRGDVVVLLNAADRRVGYGIANYGAEELRAISGARSDQILGKLGHHYGDEAVHRNNMVTL